MSLSPDWSIWDEMTIYKETYKPLLRLQEGETEVTIRLYSLMPVRTQYGESVKFTVVKDGDEYVLLVRRNSRLYRALMGAIIQYLKANPQADTIRVKIIRSGRGKTTTYEVKPI